MAVSKDGDEVERRVQCGACTKCKPVVAPANARNVFEGTQPVRGKVCS